MADQRTIALYTAEAEAYADRVDTDRPHPDLDTFVDTLPEGGRVLDLGCGSGVWAARMAARGLRVEAVDASEGLARVARERYGITVRVATFDDISEIAAYDGIWAHFSLLHAARDALPRHLAALARALKPTGSLLIAMKLGEGAHRDGKDRLYTYYTDAELSVLLGDAGFRITAQRVGTDTGFDGTRHDYIVIHATRD